MYAGDPLVVINAVSGINRSENVKRMKERHTNHMEELMAHYPTRRFFLALFKLEPNIMVTHNNNRA